MKKLFSPKILALCLVCMSGFIQIAKSQSVQNMAFSPQAAKLINDIKYPIGYNTGSVDISIPLFDMCIGRTKFPVSISYNTKGVHINDLNRYTGIGWSINIEPTIARKINGNPDVLNGCLHSDDSYWTNKHANRTGYDVLNRAAPDRAPDEYFYKLLGTSGSFMTQYAYQSYSIKSLSKLPVAISAQMSNQRNDYKAFTLTDDNGCIYNFPSEITDISSDYIYTLWHVSKITPPIGTGATFAYTDRKKDINVSYNDKIIIEDTKNYNAPFQPNCFLPFDLSSKTYLPRITRNYARDGKVEINVYHSATDSATSYIHRHKEIRQPYSGCNLPNLNSGISSAIESRVIDSIIHEEGIVKFNRGDNQKINSIDIKKVDGTLIRTIEFQYSDIFTGYPEGAIKHEPYYLLKFINIKDRNNGIIDRYRLTYNDTVHINWSHIEQNCFGYVQDQSTTSNSLLPIFNNYQSNYINFSFPRFSAFGSYVSFVDSTRLNINDFGTVSMEISPGRNVMLKSIENTLGKVTTLDYETDVFKGFHYDDIWKNDPIVTGTFRHAGGALRIKSITESSFGSNGKLINNSRTLLTYNDGLVKIQPTIRNYMSAQYNYNISDPIRYRTIHSRPISKSSYGNVPVMYDTIHETKQIYDPQTDTWKNVERNVYTYDYKDREIRSYHAVFQNTTVDMEENDEWCNGLLSSIANYKIDNNIPKLLQKTEYKYIKRNEDMVGMQQPYQYKIRDSAIPDNDIYFDYYYGVAFVSYQQYCSGRMDKISETTRTYSETDNTYNETLKRYKYNNEGYPIEITTYCDGDSIIENIKYSREKALSILTDKHILSPVIEKKVTYAEDNYETTLNEYFNYAEFPILGRVWVSHSKRADPDKRVEYGNHDIYGNPCYIDEGEFNRRVLIWGYNGQYLLAEIRNATYKEVNTVINSLTGKNITQLSVGYSPLYDKISKLRINPSLAKAHITTYEYIPCVGMTRKTDPSGRSAYFTYDTAGRLTNIKDDSGRDVEEYKYNVKMN